MCYERSAQCLESKPKKNNQCSDYVISPTRRVQVAFIDDITNLKKKPLIGEYNCLIPVDAIMKWKSPSVAENNGNASGSQSFQESKAAESTSSRNQAEGSVHQEDFIVVSAILEPFL